MQPEDLITYESLVQEAVYKYHGLVDSKYQEHVYIKEKYQDQPLLLKVYIAAIEYPVNMTKK